MRCEREMLELILTVAREDERIRAVYMNGSRANPNAPKDIFQDYDIVYVVTDTAPYIEDAHWIDRFGARLYMQCPDEMDALCGEPTDFSACYGWLMQLADGNRLDLHVERLDRCRIREDALCLLLLDKDGLFPDIPAPTGEGYRVQPPTAGEFRACCNEFWWCLNNVAKGLWRGEIPYVHDMLDRNIRPQLLKLLAWQAGAAHVFAISVGKSGKYLGRYLPDAVYRAFLSTYAGSDAEEIWQAVFRMCELFDVTARSLAAALSMPYHAEEAEASRAHLAHVHRLPFDATEVY